MTEIRVVVPDEIAQRLAAEAGRRGTSTEYMAAEVLSEHVPAAVRRPRFGFIGIARAVPGRPSVAVAERLLEDHEDEEFGRSSS